MTSTHLLPFSVYNKGIDCVVAFSSELCESKGRVICLTDAKLLNILVFLRGGVYLPSTLVLKTIFEKVLSM